MKCLKRKGVNSMKSLALTICLYLALCFLQLPSSRAFFGDGGAGWVQVTYLTKILTENIRRYEQLKRIIETEKNRDNYLRLINAGLENSIGLLNSLPIKDAKILSDLKNFNQAYKSIVRVYGQVPHSLEATMHMLHDQTVVESIEMIGNLYPYTRSQEENARSIAIQSRRASPKGAARMTVESNAKILHTLNQILKINGQILKLQSEQLAMSNKYGKDSVGNFNKINKGMRSSLKSFDGDFSLLRF